MGGAGKFIVGHAPRDTSDLQIVLSQGAERQVSSRFYNGAVLQRNPYHLR